MDMNTLNSASFSPAFVADCQNEFTPLFSVNTVSIESFKEITFVLDFTNTTPQPVEICEFIPEFRRTYIGGLDYEIATDEQILAIISGYVP